MSEIYARARLCLWKQRYVDFSGPLPGPAKSMFKSGITVGGTATLLIRSMREVSLGEMNMVDFSDRLPTEKVTPQAIEDMDDLPISLALALLLSFFSLLLAVSILFRLLRRLSLNLSLVSLSHLFRILARLSVCVVGFPYISVRPSAGCPMCRHVSSMFMSCAHVYLVLFLHCSCFVPNDHYAQGIAELIGFVLKSLLWSFVHTSEFPSEEMQLHGASNNHLSV